MAENRSFQPTTPQANRSVEQGLGVGQKEMDAQRDPTRDQRATDPQRTEPFDVDGAALKGDESGSDRSDRDAAGTAGAEPLGEGTPANVDIHDLGQPDAPQDDWGEPADEGTAYSANHTRRPVKTEAERGQGRKTRAAQKDQISRRG
jgi:hypothetical protein